MEKQAARRQSALTLKLKMELIKAVDAGDCSKTEISKRYGVANSTLSTILKNRDKITTMCNQSMFGPDRKRMRMSKHEDLEAVLLMWFKQTTSQNNPVSGPLLMEKAEEFASEMGIQFSSNAGWLDRFKKRNGITFKNVNSESQVISHDMTSYWLEATLPAILQDYKACDVFNADEMGLYFRCLPERTIALQREQCSSGEKSNERLTALVACNSDGTEKLPLFVVGKNSKPRCFKNVKKLPVLYTANEESWMTANLFTDWLLELDKKFICEKRKIALIIDNSHSHAPMSLHAINLIFLPLNTASILQPCDQGIIKNLKFIYRKLLLRKYLATLEGKEEFNVSILDALHMLNSAWNLVTPKTIENGFRLAGFSRAAPKPEELIEEPESEPILDEIFAQVSSILSISISLDEYLQVDGNISTAPILSDNDMIDIVRPATELLEYSVDEIDDDPNESDFVAAPNNTELPKMLKSIRRFLDINSNGEMNETMDVLEQFIENRIIFCNPERKSVTRDVNSFFGPHCKISNEPEN